jgi:hypothetical protein
MPNAAQFENYLSTITSVLAICISSLTLGWTIYRDAIKKPTFRVSIAIKRIVQAGRGEEGPYVFVEALNTGPIPNRIGLTFARKNWVTRRFLEREQGGAMIYPDFKHWAATKASTKLEVGDQANFIFPYGANSFLKENFCQIGVSDGFGRIHWSSRSEFREAQKNIRKISPSARDVAEVGDF